MKRIIMAMLAIVVMTDLKAQENIVVNNPDNTPYWGIRVNYDYTIPGSVKQGGVGIDLFKGGSGFSVGAIYNLPIIANLYFEPGISLFYDTYRTDDIMVGADDMMFNDTHITYSNIKYIDNQLVTVIKIQMICKCKYKTI